MESDPDSKTNNALEMLRKVPLITVDGDENVTLNGQSNYKVLVNGKSSSMMSKNFKEVIKSLPANTIKDIEVITNPSSKYDAEGIGGIINIITIKKTLNGYNGSISTGFDSFGALNGGLYLSTKVNKFGFSGRYSINQNKFPGSTNNSNRENYLPTAVNQYYTNSSGNNRSKGFGQNFNGEASYDIDSLNLISMSFWGYTGNNKRLGTSTTEILSNQNTRTSYFEMLNNGNSKYQTLSGNIDYQKTYKKPEKSFTISYKLDNNPYNTEYISKTQNTFNYDNYMQRAVNDAFTREQTIQIDYYNPLTKKHQIEWGAKGIYRQNDSNSDVYLLNNLTDVLEQDKNKSNELNYNQTIMGLYGGYVYKLNKFSLKTGLRAELTWNNAASRSARDTSFTNSLKNLVPYITFTYKLKPTNTLKLSYTQRLQRPNIWYLNPYRNEMSRLYVYYGNPNLKSEIAHSFEIAYNTFTPKFNLGLTGTASFTNNSIEQITFIDSSNAQNTTYDNIGKNSKLGLNTYLSYRPNEKFNIGFNGGVMYSQLEATSMGKLMRNDGFNFRGSFNGRLTLWKNGAISANWGLFSSSIQLQGHSSAFSYTSIGLSQYFLNKKLMLNASVSDPFVSERKYISDYSSIDFKMHSESIRQSRSLRVSLSYNFGKMDYSVKKARRGIQNDDMKSGGGSN
jgi:outer membrane receptor protein involved in Fe transport